MPMAEGYHYIIQNYLFSETNMFKKKFAGERVKEIT